MSHATTSQRAAPGRPARPSLRAVPAAVERSGNGMFAAVCMALLAVGLVSLLLLNTALAQGAFALHNLTATSSALADEEQALRQSVQSRSSSAALAQRAVEMGMVPAKSMAFLRLSDGAIIGVAQPAKPDPFVLVTSARPAPPAPEPTVTADPAQPAAPAGQAPAGPAPAAAAPAPAGATQPGAAPTAAVAR